MSQASTSDTSRGLAAVAVVAVAVEDAADAPMALPEVATLTATHPQDVAAVVDAEAVAAEEAAVAAAALRSARRLLPSE